MRTAIFLAALAALQVSSVLAQNPPPCDGDIDIVRTSAIEPGAMQGFMGAVAAHKAWYRSHGFNDNVIVASRVNSARRQDRRFELLSRRSCFPPRPAAERGANGSQEGRGLGCLRKAVTSTSRACLSWCRRLASSLLLLV